MTLRLYDTATRQLVDLVPRTPGQVGIYVCGVTVQDRPHIGHLRSGLNYDVLRRWLTRSGLDVTLVRNITDVDDKVLAKAIATGRPFWSIAYANELVVGAAYRELNVLPPTYEPRATGHIPQMHELIIALIERGHAYPAPDGSGDVYFDVGTWPEYGALSGRKPEEMQPAADSDPRGKRDPRDFALWKGHKPNEPETASWPAPYGRGRPGWHLECSAMSAKYLGTEFDIHGGGLDLRFPHHENELAQSRAAGHRFAHYWMHNAMVNMAGTKMSKSVGNPLLVSEVVRRVRPVELRYYLASAHYRSVIEYTDAALADAGAAYRRLEGYVIRASEVTGGVDPTSEPLPARFVEAMDDDLGVPEALAVIFERVRQGNTMLASGVSGELRTNLASVRRMLGVLGLDPLGEPWAGMGEAVFGPERLRAAVDTLVSTLLKHRDEARARRDFETADTIRDQLSSAGIVVEDTPAGPRWEIADGG